MENKIQQAMDNLDLQELVYRYITAPYGAKLGIYENKKGFSFYVSQDVGKEIAENERPIAVIPCPGLGNIDTTLWTEGWTEEQENGLYLTEDGQELTLIECIKDCCQNGDITSILEEIQAGLELEVE